MSTLLIATQAIACELHSSGLLQNSFAEFHLPAVGVSKSDLTRIYGKPLRQLSGFDGSDIWDYGSFRVFLKDDSVTFAAMG